MTTKDKRVPTTQNSRIPAHFVRGKYGYYAPEVRPEQGQNGKKLRQTGRKMGTLTWTWPIVVFYDQNIGLSQLFTSTTGGASS